METCSLKVEELLSEEHWHKQCIEAYSKWAEYSTGKGAQQQLPRWLPLASSTQYGPIVLESHFQDEGSLFCKMVGPWTLHQETFSTSLKSEYSFFSIIQVFWEHYIDLFHIENREEKMPQGCVAAVVFICSKKKVNHDARSRNSQMQHGRDAARPRWDFRSS